MFVPFVLLPQQNTMLQSFNPENVYADLRTLCRRAGTTLGEVCTAAGIPRQTVQAWKNQPPKSFALLGKLCEEIEQRRRAAETAEAAAK